MWGEDRNYKKEYKNYHSRPEQIVRRSKRNEARRLLKNRKNLKGMDVHHKDNDPLNNDKSNLSVVTQKYNRTEPRLREGLTDPQELAKEIEWAQSPKNVDSKVLSKKQKKDMRAIVKFMNRLRNPNWVNKFTQIYFTSDKLVQRRLYLSAKKAGFSSGLMKTLFPKGAP